VTVVKSAVLKLLETSNPQPELVLELDLSTGLIALSPNSDNQQIQLTYRINLLCLGK
jgi:hypothetical protein